MWSLICRRQKAPAERPISPLLKYKLIKSLLFCLLCWPLGNINLSHYCNKCFKCETNVYIFALPKLRFDPLIAQIRALNGTKTKTHLLYRLQGSPEKVHVELFELGPGESLGEVLSLKQGLHLHLHALSKGVFPSSSLKSLCMKGFILR